MPQEKGYYNTPQPLSQGSAVSNTSDASGEGSRSGYTGDEQQTMLNAASAMAAAEANPGDAGAALIASSAVAAAAAGAAAALLAEKSREGGSQAGSQPSHSGRLSQYTPGSSFVEGGSGGQQWPRNSPAPRGDNPRSNGNSPREGGAYAGLSGPISGASPSPPHSQADQRSFMGMSGGFWTGPEIYAAEDQVEVVMGTLFHSMDTDEGLSYGGAPSSTNTLVATGTLRLLTLCILAGFWVFSGAAQRTAGTCDCKGFRNRVVVVSMRVSL